MQLTGAHDTTVLAVVGNPKPASRTRSVALEVADRVADALPSGGVGASVDVLEVVDLGRNLLERGDQVAAEAVARMAAADVLVVASPVFKATYTGLLKMLLDQVPAGHFAGMPAVPLLVGGGPAHAMAVEVHLRPLLVELGASCPTAGLYVLDSTLDRLNEVLDPWAERWLPILAGAVLSRRQAEVPA